MNQPPPFYSNNDGCYHRNQPSSSSDKCDSCYSPMPKLQKSMLLPTKVYQDQQHNAAFVAGMHHHHTVAASSTYNSNSKHHSSISVSTLASSSGPVLVSSSSRWKAQPIMEWIESLAIATKNSTSPSSTTSLHDPIIYKLAEPTPEVCMSLHDTIVSQPTLLSSSDEEYDGQHVFLLDEKNIASCQWDLSYFSYHDPSSWTYIQKIKSLAGTFERLIAAARTKNSFCEMSDSYQMVQTRLTFTFDRIMWQYHNPNHSFDPSSPTSASNLHAVSKGETRFLLDSLYEETCDKLHKLIVAFKSPDKGSYPTKYCNTNMSRLPVDTTEMNHPYLTKPMNKHQTKQELGKYMTSWLRANFTNPYPDDEGLLEMANHCGTTNQVISNWLINARTRKWRPAIIKASELGRPADMLLEDSMNIFDNKPIRSLFNITPSGTIPIRSSSASAIIFPTTVISASYPTVLNTDMYQVSHGPPAKCQRLPTIDATATNNNNDDNNHNNNQL